jgi:hypothetical protein
MVEVGKDVEYDEERQVLQVAEVIVKEDHVKLVWAVKAMSPEEYEQRQENDRDVARTRVTDPYAMMQYHIIHGTVPAEVTNGGEQEFADWYGVLRKEKKQKDKDEIKAKKAK